MKIVIKFLTDTVIDLCTTAAVGMITVSYTHLDVYKRQVVTVVVVVVIIINTPC